jgi:hypothetical protein
LAFQVGYLYSRPEFAKLNVLKYERPRKKKPPAPQLPRRERQSA